MTRKLPEALKAHQFKKASKTAPKKGKKPTKLDTRRKKGAPVTPDLRAH